MKIAIFWEKLFENKKKGGLIMLRQYETRRYQMPQEEIKALVREKRAELVRQQLLIKEQALPVFVLVEGWGASGKGLSLIHI